MNQPSHPKAQSNGGFTLVELMLSTVILSTLILLLTSTLSDMQKIISRSQTQVSEFEGARKGFESMSRRISQATLNAYWGYVFDDPKAANPNPKYFTRQSDLHFVSDNAKVLLPNTTGLGQAVFFQALLGDVDPATTLGGEMKGLHDLLNCWGYYVDYGSDLTARPSFLQAGTSLTVNPERKRFRLMEFRQPPDQSILFDPSFDLINIKERQGLYRWFRGPYKAGKGSYQEFSHPVAENILALIITPYTYVTTGNSAGVTKTDMRKKNTYEYDSRKQQWTSGSGIGVTSMTHRPPPLLEITLVATDEKSYDQLEQRLGIEGAANAIRAVFDGLLKDPTKFAKDVNPNVNQNPNQEFESVTIEKRMNELGMHYKIFSTTFPISASKWITENEQM